MSSIDFHFEPHQVVRGPRQRRLVQATMATGRGPDCDILVRNVSDRGIGATAKSSLPSVGDAVQVLLPGQIVASGAVRWVSGSAFGVALDSELDLVELVEAIRRQHECATSGHEWQVHSRHRVIVPPQGKLRRI